MIHRNKIQHKNILDYLQNTGLTEQHLAQLIGVSQPYVNMLKNQRRRPTPEVAQKIEAVTGIPFKKLLLKERGKK